MHEIPPNRFQIFLDDEVGYYRVILDGIELTHHIDAGGVSIDFSDETIGDGLVLDWPMVTLRFHAMGGLDLDLPATHIRSADAS